jgi:hypothetical protein
VRGVKGQREESHGGATKRRRSGEVGGARNRSGDLTCHGRMRLDKGDSDRGETGKFPLHITVSSPLDLRQAASLGPLRPFRCIRCHDVARAIVSKSKYIDRLWWVSLGDMTNEGCVMGVWESHGMGRDLCGNLGNVAFDPNSGSSPSTTVLLKVRVQAHQW